MYAQVLGGSTSFTQNNQNENLPRRWLHLHVHITDSRKRINTREREREREGKSITRQGNLDIHSL
jgi:hypothetical protein